MNTTTHIIPKLTAEQKELVRDVLEKEERYLWLDRLALPPPAGLGIRMSQATLYRLKQQLELEENLSDRESIKEQARAVANEEQNATLEAAALTLLREKAFALAASDNSAEIRTACHIIRHLNGVTKKQSNSLAKDASNEGRRTERANGHRPALQLDRTETIKRKTAIAAWPCASRQYQRQERR